MLTIGASGVAKLVRQRRQELVLPLVGVAKCGRRRAALLVRLLPLHGRRELARDRERQCVLLGTMAWSVS